MIKSFFYTLKQSLLQLVRNKTMALTSLFSITAMLLILGMFFILAVNVNLMTANMEQQFDMVEVYLLDETPEEEIQTMVKEFEALDTVAEVEYLTKEDAMQEMQTRWGENAYLLDGLSENPLPRSIQVTVKDVEDSESIVTFAENFSGVEDIKDSQAEVDKILKITGAVQAGALVIIIFLIIVSVVVVSNTVKLTVLARGREISIMKYVGATNWFIRGPFLAEGIIIGMIAAAISSGLISLLYYYLSNALSLQFLVLFSTGLVRDRIQERQSDYHIYVTRHKHRRGRQHHFDAEVPGCLDADKIRADKKGRKTRKSPVLRQILQADNEA